MGRTRMESVAMAALVVVVGVVVGHLLSAALEIRVGEKELSGLEWSGNEPAEPGPAPAAAPAEPLPLRMVDAGGVGIPADTAAWGGSYSHATYAFDHLLLDGAPWIDHRAAATVRRDWRRYLERMRRYGNNAVAVDAFLELLTFEGVGDGLQVYDAGHPLRHRHRAFREWFGLLVDDARALGMEVYLKTDLPALTPPLERHLVRTVGALDTSDPAFWDVYAQGLRELFREMPGVAGLVVRIGEAGPLYNADGVEYASYMGVREPAQLQRMLHSLLPAFEEAGRTLIFRSWSVGVGALGDLHNDPEVYREVLGPIESDALVVSTKFVQGDFFGFLPLNPTLLVGDHRRIIEYQARREYEGFGALPNWMGHAHAASLRRVRAANPKLVGTWLWTQEGGPLRTGPLSLYSTAGFWRWTDANVWATSRLARNPDADPTALARGWVEAELGDDPRLVAGMTDILLTSREALEKAVYIRPYAEQRVEIVGIDAPPILWIFEWDVIGGWSSVLATLYRTLSDDIGTPIAEGYEALALTREMQETLAALEPELAAHPDYPQMRASLEYQGSLYRALADFRALFLRYYAWLDRGGDAAGWQAAAERFQASATAHMARFGGDLDAPAFDFGPAVASVERAREGLRAREWARALVVVLGLVFSLGSTWSQRRTGHYPGKGLVRAIWVGASQPYRLARELTDSRRPAWALWGVVVTTSAVAASLLLAGPWVMALGLVALMASYTVALARSWKPESGGARLAHAPAALGPLLLAAFFVLAVLAVRGPDHFWYLFWTENLFRTAAFGLPAVLVLWALLSSHLMGRRLGGRPSFAGGSVLMATGLVLLVLSGILPDLTGTLAALDDPLHLVPMRRAIINGVTHYGGLSEAAVHAPGVLGAVLMLGGAALRRMGRKG